MTRTLTLAGYAVLLAAMVALEAVARRSGRVGTLGSALEGLRATPPARLVVLAGWLWLGWHLFVRVHH